MNARLCLIALITLTSSQCSAELLSTNINHTAKPNPPLDNLIAEAEFRGGGTDGAFGLNFNFNFNDLGQQESFVSTITMADSIVVDTTPSFPWARTDVLWGQVYIRRFRSVEEFTGSLTILNESDNSIIYEADLGEMFGSARDCELLAKEMFRIPFDDHIGDQLRIDFNANAMTSDHFLDEFGSFQIRMGLNLPEPSSLHLSPFLAVPLLLRRNKRFTHQRAGR